MSKKKVMTPEEEAERWAKITARLGELHAQGKLNKAGEWAISEEGQQGLWTIADMKAVMK